MKNSLNFLAATDYHLRMLRSFVSAVFATVLLAGCTVGPKYVRPTAEIPADFKDAAEWKAAQPSDEIAKGKWWEIYQDPQLNSLEEQVAVSNQNLKAAEAQFAQARAALQVTRSGQFPTVTGGLSGTRFHRIEQPRHRRLHHKLFGLRFASGCFV